MKRYHIWSILLLVSSFIIGSFVIGSLPAMVASHWNAQGQVDGYVGREIGAFGFPVLMTVVYTICAVLVAADPLKKNIRASGNYIGMVLFSLTAFFFYVYVLTIFWNLGGQFDLSRFVVLGFAPMFAVLGLSLAKIKRNYVIGIRTPWTLASDAIWDKTHKVASKLFILAAIATGIYGLFFVQPFLFFLITIVLVAVVPVAYSFREYKKR